MDPAAPSGVGGLIRAIEAARTLQVLLCPNEVIE
jgi:hypothetical protein